MYGETFIPHLCQSPGDSLTHTGQGRGCDMACVRETLFGPHIAESKRKKSTLQFVKQILNPQLINNRPIYVSGYCPAEHLGSLPVLQTNAAG